MMMMMQKWAGSTAAAIRVRILRHQQTGAQTSPEVSLNHFAPLTLTGRRLEQQNSRVKMTSLSIGCLSGNSDTMHPGFLSCQATTCVD
ncbi:unnamed protein product [Pleuronectes platessa]|uniref:Uncharacterized protein n=1 Tax=Pleuronectes platessa TaxID=8262 RepID=A0A9N7TJD4_PLEPL|nr:unnamed protein product [Pleuronectes platessa]